MEQHRNSLSMAGICRGRDGDPCLAHWGCPEHFYPGGRLGEEEGVGLLYFGIYLVWGFSSSVLTPSLLRGCALGHNRVSQGEQEALHTAKT